MAKDDVAGGQGCPASRHDDEARPPHGRWPRAVCSCEQCSAAMAAYLLRTGTVRARLEREGRHVPPLPADADRYGLVECDECEGEGGHGTCEDCYGGGLRESGDRCHLCDGSGHDHACGECKGRGEVTLRRCDQCGHASPSRFLKPDDRLAALRNWTGTAWVCGLCVPCEGCPAWTHADVVTDSGLCPTCSNDPSRLVAGVEAPNGPAPAAGLRLLPERAASFLRSEAGSETVEHGILVGLIVAGLVGLIALIAVGVMKALRTLRGELDPGR